MQLQQHPFFLRRTPAALPVTVRRLSLDGGDPWRSRDVGPPPTVPPAPGLSQISAGDRLTDRMGVGLGGGVGWRGTGKEVTERGKNGGRKDTRQTVALPLENDFFVAPQDVFFSGCFFSSAPLTDREGM